MTKAIASFDPSLIFALRTFDDHMHVALLVPVLMLTTVTGLGALALVLAVVGLYSTVFYSVRQRRNEIGIRVALGAQPRDLFRLVLRHTALLTCIGVVIGVTISMLALPIVSSLFYGIRPVESFFILS